MSIGNIVNRVLDAFLPDAVGDVVGATIDGLTGNAPACVQQALDAAEDLFECVGAERAADALSWLSLESPAQATSARDSGGL